MELVERKIGETFEFKGKKIEVKAASSDECDGCFFNTKCTLESRKLSGECDRDWRNDRKSVLFVEVQEHQVEESKERKIGEVFEYEEKKLKVIETEKNICSGCYFYNNFNCQKTFRECGKCGKEARSDNKPIIFVEVKEESEEKLRKTEEIKSEKLGIFNPKTLKPFDKVIARIDEQGIWCCELFSFIENNTNLVKCCGAYYKYCIPYNDETKYLIGTTNEVPEYYKYWKN